MSLTKDDLIHEIFKSVMFAVGEAFEEQEDDDYFDDDDDLIPEEKVTTDIFEEKILDAITLTVEELIDNGEIHLD